MCVDFPPAPIRWIERGIFSVPPKRHCQGFKEMSFLMTAAYRSVRQWLRLDFWDLTVQCHSPFQANYSDNNAPSSFFSPHLEVLSNWAHLM